MNLMHSNQFLTTLSIRSYDDYEYNQPYSTKNEGKYIYKTKLQKQKKYWLFLSQIWTLNEINQFSIFTTATKCLKPAEQMVSIPISTNIVKTIANLIYIYIVTMATNSIEECRQIRCQLERERQRETCQPHNTTERETCQPHNRTIQVKRKRTTERETCQPYNRAKKHG